jgi:hypothetical protein
MNKAKIFTDLFGRKFRFVGDTMNQDETDIFMNLESKWTLISIFTPEQELLIGHYLNLFKKVIPLEEAIIHENPVMYLFIYKDKLSDVQMRFVQMIKEISQER